nr:glucose-6-phosphate 1-dehydrogenase 1, chloroplastic [Ipomoea batatas]
MLSITVVGASGDLAKKKIFPALFALFYEILVLRDEEDTLIITGSSEILCKIICFKY